MDDPQVEHQEEEVDASEHPEVNAEGHPIEHVTTRDLVKGVELEESPTEIHQEGHPTPDHPSGRLGP